MIVACAETGRTIPNVRDFDLKHTLESAQSFRWENQGSGYIGLIRDEVYYLEQRGCDLFWRTTAEVDQTSYLRHYLDLERDLQWLRSMSGKDEYTEPAFNTFWGMRLLRQDLWECLGSFILSSNNSVARIRGIIARMSAKFGHPIEFEGCRYYGFPSAESLASNDVAALQACGMGYRAPYLLQTSTDVAEGRIDLDALEGADYGEAKAVLMQCAGVGEKVADCVCLFSLGHYQALPVDVWIRRIIETLYLGRTATYRQIREFAQSYFGEHMGYVQQYLFHYARTVGYPELAAQSRGKS